LKPQPRKSLTWLAQRHEPLRTTFPTPDGDLKAHISKEAVVKLTVHDLQSLAKTEREVAARQQLTAAACRPFDLENGPLLRVDLWQLSPTHHLMLINVHHINFDGWSEAILRDELTACYHAFTQGNQPTLPPLPIAYSEFAHWQRQQAASNAWAADLVYRQQQLRGDIPTQILPMDLTDTAVSPIGAEQSIYLSLDLVEQLQIMGQKQEATLFMTFVHIRLPPLQLAFCSPCYETFV
jgi:hypothetical protein